MAAPHEARHEAGHPVTHQARQGLRGLRGRKTSPDGRGHVKRV